MVNLFYAIYFILAIIIPDFLSQQNQGISPQSIKFKFCHLMNLQANNSATGEKPQISATVTDQPPEHDRRTRSLTVNGASLFDAKCKVHADRVNNQIKVIQDLSASDFSLFDQVKKCEQFKLRILSEYRIYCTMPKEFHEFLTRKNLPQCMPILESLWQKYSKYYSLSDAIIAHISSRRVAL